MNGAFRIAGRGRQLAELLALFGGAERGEGRAVVILGGPGMGKTHLARALAFEAEQRRARVVWGRAWEFGGAPAYWPLHEAFAALGEDFLLSDAAQAANLGDAASASYARGKAFERIARSLAGRAQETPLVIVLDDLHAADVPTLELVTFLARRLTRTLILGTARDADTGASESQREAVARLLGAAKSLPLSGLDPDGVGELGLLLTGETLPETSVRILIQLTAGVPLFVEELIAHAARRGAAHQLDASATPASVRDAVRRHLATLEPDVRQAVEAAAIIGKEAGVMLLAKVTRSDVETLLSLLRKAVTAKVVLETGDHQYAFAHALFRDVLYEDVDPARRASLHRLVAATMEETASDKPDAAAEVSRHWLACAVLDEAHRGRGIDWAQRAAEHAMRALAWEEAVALAERALSALDQGQLPDPMRRAELAIALGDALRAAGNGPRAADSYRHALSLANDADRGDLYARAAIGCAATREFMMSDVSMTRMLETAAEKLGDEQTVLRARVLARLAQDLVMDPSTRARRDALSRSAVELCRRLGDGAALAFVLDARQTALYGPSSIGERLAAGDELVEIARVLGDDNVLLAGLKWKVSALLELGEVARAEQHVEEYAQVAERRKQPGPVINSTSRRAALALARGEWQEGLRLATEARDVGARAGDPSAELLYAAQRVEAAFELGRPDMLDECLVALSGAAARVRAPHMISGLATRVLVASGRVDEAKVALDRLAVHDFEDLPEDFVHVGTLATLARIVHDLGDAPRAKLLRAKLDAYAEGNVMIGTAQCLGSAARFVGLAAIASGDGDYAVRTLSNACKHNLSMGFLPWAARSRADLARALISLGERAAGEDEARRARDEAERLGMVALLAELDEHRAPTRLSTRDEIQYATFSREGEVVRVVFRRRTVRLRSQMGMRHLLHLLTHPNEQVPALELALGSGVDELPPAGGSGPLLDARAKRELKERIAQIDGLLEDARMLNNGERVAELEEERGAIVREVARSLGLGGRDRRATGPAERSRVAVTTAIKRAVGIITNELPEVGEHLRRSVRTGATCSYDPDPSSSIRCRIDDDP